MAPFLVILLVPLCGPVLVSWWPSTSFGDIPPFVIVGTYALVAFPAAVYVGGEAGCGFTTTLALLGLVCLMLCLGIA